MNTLLLNTIERIKFENNLNFDSLIITNTIQLEELCAKDKNGPQKVLIINQDPIISATSIKAFNILRINQLDLKKSILALLGTSGTLITKEPISIILGVFSLIALFIDTFKIKLYDIDAKILLAIYSLGRICAISTIKNEYSILYSQEISTTKLNQSIKRLENLHILKSRKTEVEIIESILIDRKGY